MTRSPTPEHLVSWAKLCPRTIQSGPLIRGGKGNPYLKGALGEAAAAAARTNTFLGERRRLVKRRGKLKALVAVARSILVIVWQLLSDPTPDFTTSAPTTTPAACHRPKTPQPHRPPNHDGIPRHCRTRGIAFEIHTRAP
jgi:transposase IS116/IS110/IS902 family protein